jgi:hypothetical protein
MGVTNTIGIPERQKRAHDDAQADTLRAVPNYYAPLLITLSY